MPRSARDLVIAGLVLVSLLTPWLVGYQRIHQSTTFGWQSPAGDLAAIALIAARVPCWRRLRPAAIGLVVTGLGGWLLWIAVLVLPSDVRQSGYAFTPTDFLGEGWYLAAFALAVTLDGIATEDARTRPSISARDVWPLAIVPGMGLVRMELGGSGRLWLAAAVLAVFLLQSAALSPAELTYYGSVGALPPIRNRTGELLFFALLVLVWMGSLADTWRRRHAIRAAG